MWWLRSWTEITLGREPSLRFGSRPSGRAASIRSSCAGQTISLAHVARSARTAPRNHLVCAACRSRSMIISVSVSAKLSNSAAVTAFLNRDRVGCEERSAPSPGVRPDSSARTGSPA